MTTSLTSCPPCVSLEPTLGSGFRVLGFGVYPSSLEDLGFSGLGLPRDVGVDHCCYFSDFMNKSVKSSELFGTDVVFQLCIVLSLPSRYSPYIL